MVHIRPQEPRTYDLQEQLELSRLRDSEIDKHFAGKWEISRATSRSVERMGVDRLWTHKESGRRWLVEYKHDTQAHRTGNVFIETWSVEGKKRGWAYTSCARAIVYYVVGGEYAFVTRMDEIERRLTSWELMHPEKPATTADKRTGETYRTLGVCVPLFLYRGASDCVVPVYSGDEPAAKRENVIPMLRGSGVLK